MTGNVKPWRMLDTNRYIEDMVGAIRKRCEDGIDKYGDTFKGQPLQHLEQELLDALFYVYYLREQLESEI